LPIYLTILKGKDNQLYRLARLVRLVY